MQMHTIYGAQIIEMMMKDHSKKNPWMQMAYNIALHHHQIYAGFGYPRLIVVPGQIGKHGKCFNHPIVHHLNDLVTQIHHPTGLLHLDLERKQEPANMISPIVGPW